MQSNETAAQRTASSRAVQRINGLSPEKFLTNNVMPRRPVVLLDAMDGWKASAWTPEMFARKFGERRVIVAYGSQWRKMLVSDLVRTVEQVPNLFAPRADSPFVIDLRNRHIGEDFPELMEDFTISGFFSSNWLAEWPLKRYLPFADKASIELFIGGVGAMGLKIHRDAHMTHAWISQLYGTKRIWLVAPEYDTCMYPDPGNRFWSLINDLERPNLSIFPLFRQATVLSTLLTPGETIFLPAGWWHTAECTSASISLSGNFANASNFAELRQSMVLGRFRKPSRAMRILNQSALWFHERACLARGL